MAHMESTHILYFTIENSFSIRIGLYIYFNVCAKSRSQAKKVSTTNNSYLNDNTNIFVSKLFKSPFCTKYTKQEESRYEDSVKK